MYCLDKFCRICMKSASQCDGLVKLSQVDSAEDKLAFLQPEANNAKLNSVFQYICKKCLEDLETSFRLETRCASVNKIAIDNKIKPSNCGELKVVLTRLQNTEDTNAQLVKRQRWTRKSLKRSKSSKPIDLTKKSNYVEAPSMGKPKRSKTSNPIDLTKKSNFVEAPSMGKPKRSKSRMSRPPYKCDKCKESFNLKIHLVLHSCSHSQGERCTICSVRFETIEELNKHKEEHRSLNNSSVTIDITNDNETIIEHSSLVIDVDESD